jgi:phage terminase small subunit
MADELTPRQMAFVAAYARHGVAERAAVAAGYSRKTARSQAARLLANVGIRAELAALAKATRSDDIADVAELRRAWTGAMRSRELPWRDRLRASELLGKSLGAFVEKVEHSGEVRTSPPVVNLTFTTKEKAYPELYGPGSRLAHARRDDPATTQRGTKP